MRPHRLVLAVLGTTVLQLDVGTVDPPPAPAEDPEPADTSGAVGAVTDRRAAPQVGFSPAAALPRDPRPVIR